MHYIESARLRMTSYTYKDKQERRRENFPVVEGRRKEPVIKPERKRANVRGCMLCREPN